MMKCPVKALTLKLFLKVTLTEIEFKESLFILLKKETADSVRIIERKTWHIDPKTCWDNFKKKFEAGVQFGNMSSCKSDGVKDS